MLVGWQYGDDYVGFGYGCYGIGFGFVVDFYQFVYVGFDQVMFVD